MTKVVFINETMLQVVNAPYTQNLVTKESCVAYLQETARWNTYLRIIAAVAVAMMFYYMYKQGKFNKEKNFISEALKDGGNNIPDGDDNRVGDSDIDADGDGDANRAVKHQSK